MDLGLSNYLERFRNIISPSSSDSRRNFLIAGAIGGIDRLTDLVTGVSPLEMLADKLISLEEALAQEPNDGKIEYSGDFESITTDLESIKLMDSRIWEFIQGLAKGRKDAEIEVNYLGRRDFIEYLSDDSKLGQFNDLLSDVLHEFRKLGIGTNFHINPAYGKSDVILGDPNNRAVNIIESAGIHYIGLCVTYSPYIKKNDFINSGFF